MSKNIYIMQSNRNKDESIKAGDIKTTDIRLQGKNVEKVLVDFFEQLKKNKDKIETNVTDSVTTTVTGIVNNELKEMDGKISVIKQTADKIDLLVKTTDSEGNIALTDTLFSAIAKNIKLTADNIDLNGYVSNRTVTDEDGNEVTLDGNWHISNDGEIGAKNLSVEENISTDSITVNDIVNPQYPKSLSGDIDIYIDKDSGQDDALLQDESTFKTLNGLLKVLPKNLNGNTVTITLNTDITEDVVFRFYTTGRMFIYLNSHTINGYVWIYTNTADVRMLGGTSVDSAPTTNGKIMPLSLKDYINNMSASVLVGKSLITTIKWVDIYGKTDDTGSSGIQCADFSGLYLKGCSFNDCYNGVSANNQSRVYASDTSGKVANIGWKADSGADIRLNNTTQMGGVTNYKEIDCGTVITPKTTPSSISGGTSGDAKYDADGTNNENTNNGASSKVKTVTYKATSADTYRLNVYTGWKKDGTARQGDFGYGDCLGFFFFGNQFSNLKGKSIKSLKITVKRISGGYSTKSVAIKFKMHNYSSRPSKKPSFLTTWDDSVSVRVGNYASLTVTDSSVLSAIYSGKMKGFGIQATYDKSHYAVCSGYCKVEVTYVDE